jgi:hypothetical protein
MLAADLLVRAGATPNISAEPGDDRRDVAEALRLLGGLPDHTLADYHVVEAMHQALLAHASTR